ncbi:MAG: carbohydrate kinase [Granulosicoccus sp.]
MFLCCGDALFDLFASPGGSKGSINLNGTVGGSPLNVAVGLARMDNPTGFLCKNSFDVFGTRIQQFLADNDVSLDWLISSSQNSTLAIVELDDQGVATYVFYTDNTADISLQVAELPKTLPTDIGLIHVGSYSTAVDPTGSSLLSLVQREQNQRLISYDPNIRPSIEPDLDIWRERFSGYAATAKLIKASDEDIATLFGADCAFDEFAADAISQGTELVFVTRGGNGALAYSCSGEQFSADGIAVDVIDTVGAGDTFQAAVLHGLQAQKAIDRTSFVTSQINFQETLDFAVAAAAVTCTRRGADLPSLDDITSFRNGKV